MVADPDVHNRAVEMKELLISRAETVATAESLTGGLLADRLTDLPGSSAVFVGGVVSYAVPVKTDVLDVPHAVIDGPGVVSSECAAAMAEGVRRLLGTSYGVSTTGEAGPEPAGSDPVGTVWVGVAGPQGTVTEEVDLGNLGERRAIRQGACDAALSLLWDILHGEQASLG